MQTKEKDGQGRKRREKKVPTTRTRDSQRNPQRGEWEHHFGWGILFFFLLVPICPWQLLYNVTRVLVVLELDVLRDCGSQRLPSPDSKVQTQGNPMLYPGYFQSDLDLVVIVLEINTHGLWSDSCEWPYPSHLWNDWIIAHWPWEYIYSTLLDVNRARSIGSSWSSAHQF